MSSLQNCIQAFVDQLVVCGLKHAVICPGSRNAPLIQALLNQNITCHSVVDERSAAFMCLGMAQELAEPVAVVCTSGTALANIIPASIEAYYSGIPMLILSADRPQYLIDQWDGQCIRQNGLLSQHIAAEYNTPENYESWEPFIGIAKEAYSKCIHPNGGPVHINLPFHEPLYSRATDRKSDLTQHELPNYQSKEEDLQKLQVKLKHYSNLLVLNGTNFPMSIASEEYDFPILSDLLSNRKELENIAYWDAFISDSEACKNLQPDLLITTGRSTVSKSLKLFLRKFKPKEHLHISLFNRVGDPFQSSPQRLHISDNDFWQTIGAAKPKNEQLMLWQEFSNKAAQKIQNFERDSWNELQAVQDVLLQIPAKSKIHLSNSMAVRYASFVLARTDLICAGNRGTSGIDGCTSTAMGSALVSSNLNVLITGDISFFYDINGLWQRTLPKNILVIVLNNGGGEIFNLINGPSTIEEALPYQLTPHERSIKTAASEFGFGYLCANDYQSLQQCLNTAFDANSAQILEIKTNPNINKAFYERFKSIKI